MLPRPIDSGGICPSIHVFILRKRIPGFRGRSFNERRARMSATTPNNGARPVPANARSISGTVGMSIVSRRGCISRQSTRDPNNIRGHYLNILPRGLTGHHKPTIILSTAVHWRRIHVDASRSNNAFSGCIHRSIESGALKCWPMIYRVADGPRVGSKRFSVGILHDYSPMSGPWEALTSHAPLPSRTRWICRRLNTRSASVTR